MRVWWASPPTRTFSTPTLVWPWEAAATVTAPVSARAAAIARRRWPSLLAKWINPARMRRSTGLKPV